MFNLIDSLLAPISTAIRFYHGFFSAASLEEVGASYLYLPEFILSSFRFTAFLPDLFARPSKGINRFRF